MKPKPTAKQVYNFYECSLYLEKKHNKDFSDYFGKFSLKPGSGGELHKSKYETETGDIDPGIVELPDIGPCHWPSSCPYMLKDGYCQHITNAAPHNEWYRRYKKWEEINPSPEHANFYSFLGDHHELGSSGDLEVCQENLDMLIEENQEDPEEVPDWAIEIFKLYMEEFDGQILSDNAPRDYDNFPIEFKGIRAF